MAKNVQLDKNGYRKFGMRDCLAYAAGDFGCNMSFALKGTMLIFWTQFMKIDATLYAMLLLIVQVWDAINDPLIGSLIDADRRQYKKNKFLTYIWVGSIGLCVAGAMCFIPVPNAPYAIKIILYMAGYILWDAFYTVANVPYGSMLSLISDDPADRASLSTWRSVGSMVGNIATMVLIPILIYDASNNLMGQRVFFIALIMGIMGFLAFQFMIKNTEVRVSQAVTCKEDAPKFNVIKSMGNFMKNRAAVGATLAAVGMFLGMNSASTANTVMFQSYFKNAQASGVVMLIGFLPMFLFMPFIRKIVTKWGKKEAAIVGSAISTLGCTLMLILPISPDIKGMGIFMGCMVLNGLGNGVYTCISWSLMADAIDWNEYKNGTRDEGVVYSLHSFFRKLAQGVGPSLVLVIMAKLGYDGALGAAQSAAVALNMRYLVAALYLFSAAIMLISVWFVFNLDKKTLAMVKEELDKRHAAN